MVEQPGEPVDDRESQSQTFAAIVLGVSELIELAEDVLTFFLWNARAAVDHINAHGCAATAASYEHATSRRVANGVRNEILNDTFQQHGIASQPYACPRDAQLEAPLLRERLEFVAHPCEQTVQRKIDNFRRDCAGIEARYVEQRVEQRVHCLR